MEPEIVIFNNCLVTVLTDNGYTQTTFDDKTFVPALPNYDPPAYFIAADLGYGENTKLMTVHHEILHTYLCESVGLEYSPTLWSVAHNFTGPGCIPIEKQYEEEALVLSFQKYINKKEVEPPLEWYLKENKLILRKVRDDAMKLIEDLGCKL